MLLSVKVPLPACCSVAGPVPPLAITPLTVTCELPSILNVRPVAAASCRNTFPPSVTPPVLFTVNVRLLEPELVKVPLKVIALRSARCHIARQHNIVGKCAVAAAGLECRGAGIREGACSERGVISNYNCRSRGVY